MLNLRVIKEDQIAYIKSINMSYYYTKLLKVNNEIVKSTNLEDWFKTSYPIESIEALEDDYTEVVCEPITELMKDTNLTKEEYLKLTNE